MALILPPCDQTRLEGDLASGSVLAWGQPIIELTDQRLLGVELLARWVTSDGRLLAPKAFLDEHAELHGASALTDLMLTHACEVIDADPGTDRFVSINVNPVELGTPTLELLLDRTAERLAEDAGRLVIEIVESSQVTDGSELERSVWRRAVDRMCGRGIRVAIDDFGTGFSSMERLLGAPIDIVKVDRSLIAIADDPRCQALLGGLVGFAEQAQALLVAEGIEHPDQVRDCLRLGLGAAQGYLFGRPEPIGAAYLRDGRTITPESLETQVPVQGTLSGLDER